jgi:hypothetical protein
VGSSPTALTSHQAELTGNIALADALTIGAAALLRNAQIAA